MNEDILIELSTKDLNLLADLYEKHESSAPHAYSTIKTCIDWREKKPDSNYVTVFGVEDTWLATGTFIVLMQYSCYDLFVYTLEDDCRTLYKGLKETKKIDWNRRMLWYSVSGRHISTVLDFIKELGADIYVNVVTELYVINKEEALKFEYTCPDDVYFARLKKSHAAQINEVWPHKSKNSQQYLEILIEMNKSLGLFLKSDDSLVCWVLGSPMGQMSTLQTDVNHKRKGYATLITKAKSKELAQDGFNPLGTIVQGNVASETMFSKLGFRSIDTCTFVMH